MIADTMHANIVWFYSKSVNRIRKSNQIPVSVIPRTGLINILTPMLANISQPALDTDRIPPRLGAVCVCVCARFAYH